MHTQGPWYVGSQNDLVYVINEPPRPAPVDHMTEGGSTKAVARVLLGFPAVEIDANARLIAAAPDLLEALDNLVMALELPGDHCEVDQAKMRAKAILAKVGQ